MDKNHSSYRFESVVIQVVDSGTGKWDWMTNIDSPHFTWADLSSHVGLQTNSLIEGYEDGLKIKLDKICTATQDLFIYMDMAKWALDGNDHPPRRKIESFKDRDWNSINQFLIQFNIQVYSKEGLESLFDNYNPDLGIKNYILLNSILERKGVTLNNFNQ